MADYNLKVITSDTDGPSADTELLFGAPDQSSGTPKPYSFAGVRSWINRSATTQFPYYTDTTCGLGPMLTAAPGTLALTSGRLNAMPFIVPETRTFTGFSINVITRVASSGIRLGIYNANSATRQPTTLIVDAGVVDLDTTTGAVNKNTKAISQLLTPGMYYAVFHNSLGGSISSIGAGTTGPGTLGYALSAGGTLTVVAGLNLTGETYQPFATALSDLSGKTFALAGANLPFFILT